MLEELEKYDFFHYFQEISAVPRGSEHNEAISDYLVAFAKEHQLFVYQDASYNVVIRKEAAKGYENLPGIILQGHMDMVCEKESGVEHDFTNEGLDLAVDGDYLYAKGTTLGGDDGIALAYGLAILADDTKEYPMIELVATTDEEIGMFGAKALDTGVLKGKYLINLDTEEEGSLLVGCAGGLRGNIILKLDRDEKDGICYECHVSGLLGGHSGCEIDKNRVNAALLLGRLLFEMETPFALVSMKGGTKDNAIPREAKAVLVVDEKDASAFEEEFQKRTAMYQDEYTSFEPDMKICLRKEAQAGASVIAKEQTDKILFLLNTAPNGVQAMSGDIKGLVESSLNMGIFEAEEEMKASYSVRSSAAGYKEYLSKKLACLAKSIGASYQEEGNYPAWLYRKESVLREKMVEVFRRFYQKEPVVEVIHAGLECGLLSEKMPELDMVAIGPDILDIHTPKEKLSIPSAIRVYDYLLEVLQELCKA